MHLTNIVCINAFSLQKSIKENGIRYRSWLFFQEDFSSIFIEGTEHFWTINLTKNLYQDNTFILISFWAKIDHLT